MGSSPTTLIRNQNDHDALRADPIFKLVCDRSPNARDLASQPTLSRFENWIDVTSLKRLRDVMIDQFIQSFDQPPTQVTLDLDPFDDPTHGSQQLTFFHGYYGQYQYLPRLLTCAENDMIVDLCLLHGTAHGALGADDDLEYVVGRLRAAWPCVKIHLRADSGLGVPRMFDACQRLDVFYSIGLRMNPWLQRQTDSLL
ncbi:MAG: transposase, partial [Planctomycetales bacterium]